MIDVRSAGVALAISGASAVAAAIFSFAAAIKGCVVLQFLAIVPGVVCAFGAVVIARKVADRRRYEEAGHTRRVARA